MKTIADKVGVSITTVSHVINKTRFVNQETREAVLAAMEELNYRGVKTKKSNKNKIVTIGLIIADIREDYFVAVTKAIETVAFDMEISIIICDSEDDVEKEAKNIKMLLDRNVSGLIIAPIASDKMPEELERTDIPIVLLDRQYRTHNRLFIGINNLYSGYLSAEHLHEKGAKRIGFIGYSETVYTINQRILGYKSFQLETEDDALPNVLKLNYHKENSYPLIKNFINNNNLDGLICATSAICYEVIGVLDDMPEEVQKNIKIITYDDNRWFDYLKFPLSVISQPTVEIGSAAVENIVALIEQESARSHLKRELFFDISIIDRL